MKTVPCLACGNPVVWVKSSTGIRVALDPGTPVYTIIRESFGGIMVATRTSFSMVTHAATCPKGNDSSVPGKREPALGLQDP